MNANTLIAITLAALLVFAGGAAATAGQAPDDPGADAADEHQPDDPGAESAHNTSNATDNGQSESAGEQRDESASQAPPTEMPESAADQVSQIHALIHDKICGCLTGQELGAAISGIAGNGDEARANDEAADGNDDEGSDAESADEEASTEHQNRASSADAGPPQGLPDQAADRVSQIHDAILSFLNGDGDGGESISAAASG